VRSAGVRTHRIVAKCANVPYIATAERTNVTCFYNNCTCCSFFNFRILFISHGSCAMFLILSLQSATLCRQMNVFHLDYRTHCLAARRNCHHHILQKVHKINYLGSKTGVSAFKRVFKVEPPRTSRQLAHESGEVDKATHRLTLSPSRYPCYSFLLECHSISGPYCGRKNYVDEKFH